MRYAMKQKVLSLTDSFTIKDSDGNKVYQVKGKLLSIGDKLQSGRVISLSCLEFVLCTSFHNSHNEDEIHILLVS